MSKVDYSTETKAAVMASLLSGQSITEVAKQWNIPEGTVKSWKSRQLNGETVATVATEKRQEIGDLLLEFLAETLRTLRIQARFFGDTDWLQKQDASANAVLHGVQTDKAIRLLEALNHADVADDSTPQG